MFTEGHKTANVNESSGDDPDRINDFSNDDHDKVIMIVMTMMMIMMITIK